MHYTSFAKKRRNRARNSLKDCALRDVSFVTEAVLAAGVTRRSSRHILENWALHIDRRGHRTRCNLQSCALHFPRQRNCVQSCLNDGHYTLFVKGTARSNLKDCALHVVDQGNHACSNLHDCMCIRREANAEAQFVCWTRNFRRNQTMLGCRL